MLTNSVRPLRDVARADVIDDSARPGTSPGEGAQSESRRSARRSARAGIRPRSSLTNTGCQLALRATGGPPARRVMPEPSCQPHLRTRAARFLSLSSAVATTRCLCRAHDHRFRSCASSSMFTTGTPRCACASSSLLKFLVVAGKVIPDSPAPMIVGHIIAPGHASTSAQVCFASSIQVEQRDRTRESASTVGECLAVPCARFAPLS